MDHRVALCPRRGGKGHEMLWALFLTRSFLAGPAALPSARLSRQSRFPRAFREEPGGKKARQGLNCTLLPTPRQFRGRGQDPSDLVVSAGWIITRTQLTWVRLPQSRAAPSRCSRRGFPAEHREQRAQPALPGARCYSVKMDLRFDILVQNPRTTGWGHPWRGELRAPTCRFSPL